MDAGFGAVQLDLIEAERFGDVGDSSFTNVCTVLDSVRPCQARARHGREKQ